MDMVSINQRAISCTGSPSSSVSGLNGSLQTKQTVSTTFLSNASLEDNDFLLNYAKVRRKSIPAVLNFLDSFLFATIWVQTQVIMSSWIFILRYDKMFNIYKQIKDISYGQSHFSHSLIKSTAMDWSTSWVSQTATKHFIASSASFWFSKALSRYPYSYLGGLKW